MKNEIGKYLLQYQDIYNSHIYVHDIAENHITSDASIRPNFFSLESLGDINSDIVFIEDFLLLNNSNFNSHMKKSMDLFKNILKAVNLKYKDIQIIRIKRYVDLNIDNFIRSAFKNKINESSKKLIVSLGSSFLQKNKNIKELRNNKYNYNKLDLIYTYHPKDLIENDSLKKYAWDDFKFIRDKYLYGK
jgi:DNA polymerase